MPDSWIAPVGYQFAYYAAPVLSHTYDGYWPGASMVYPSYGWSQPPQYATQAFVRSVPTASTQAESLLAEPPRVLQKPVILAPTIATSSITKPPRDWTRFLLPAFMATTALLTHQLPKRIPAGPASLLPADWKVWARIGLGIATVNTLNKAMDWKPPAWLVGLETVAVVHPLAVGLSLTTLKQMLVTMPFVAGVVQGTTWLNDQATEPAKTHLNIPPLLTRLAISAAMLVISVKLFNKVYQPILNKSILGKWLGLEALHQTGSAMFATTCARGCTPGGIICLSEAGEILGGLGLKARSGYSREKRSERA